MYHTSFVPHYLVNDYSWISLIADEMFLSTTSRPSRGRHLSTVKLWLPTITDLSTAQRSNHQFSSAKEERAALIFNYKPTDVQDYLPFLQAYFF